MIDLAGIRVSTIEEAGSLDEARSKGPSTNHGLVIVGDVVEACPVRIAETFSFRGYRVMGVLSNCSVLNVKKLFAAGAYGCAASHDCAEDMVEVLVGVANGRKVVSSSIRALTESPVDGPARKISAREREIIVLSACGLTRNQIADQLGISPRTVETLKYRAYKKLNLNNRSQLVQYALSNGLLKGARAGRLGLNLVPPTANQGSRQVGVLNSVIDSDLGYCAPKIQVSTRTRKKGLEEARQDVAPQYHPEPAISYAGPAS